MLFKILYYMQLLLTCIMMMINKQTIINHLCAIKISPQSKQYRSNCIAFRTRTLITYPESALLFSIILSQQFRDRYRAPLSTRENEYTDYQNNVR